MKSRDKGSIAEPTFLFKTGLKDGGLSLFRAITRDSLGAGPESGMDIPKAIGKGNHAVILGGGVAGLTTAYELLKHKTGYKVTVLEALGRVGGRSLTLRPGDSFTEVIGKREYTQICEFDPEPDQPYPPYLNAGPGRIPSAHRNVLNLCRELDVELQVYIMQSRSNRLYSKTPLSSFDSESGIPVPDTEYVSRLMVNRRIANDTRGYIAEYLYAHVDGLVDLNDNEKSEFKSLLRNFGTLQKDGRYIGSNRSGYTVLPGVHEKGEVVPPITFSNLLDSAFWKISFYQPEDFLWQPTSFQPVGGMDMIEKALAKAIKDLGGKIVLNAPVQEVRRSAAGWDVTYLGKDGAEKKLSANVCVSNIPMPLLESIVDIRDFSEEYGEALQKVINTKEFLRPTCKVGWQAERRLWQNPPDPNEVPIFGGISYTSDTMHQMWYPSDNFHADLGVLTGAYNYEDAAIDWGRMAPDERLVLARKQAANLHGQEFADLLEKGVTIAWQNIPTQKGGWVDWQTLNKTPEDTTATEVYNRLVFGDNEFYVCGDQVSHLPGWKEGAVASALNVVGQVARVRHYVPPTIKQVPDTYSLIQGHLF